MPPPCLRPVVKMSERKRRYARNNTKTKAKKRHAMIQFGLRSISTDGILFRM